VPQLVVVVDVFIAKRNPEYPLPNQRRNKMLDQFQATTIDEAVGKRPISRIARFVAPSSNAPASDVIAPPSNPATTARLSTAVNSNSSALHSVGIGAFLESARSRSRKTTFADSAPRCAN
jgi:hypothetical protein